MKKIDLNEFKEWKEQHCSRHDKNVMRIWKWIARNESPHPRYARLFLEFKKQQLKNQKRG